MAEAAKQAAPTDSTDAPNHSRLRSPIKAAAPSNTAADTGDQRTNVSRLTAHTLTTPTRLTQPMSEHASRLFNDVVLLVDASEDPLSQTSTRCPFGQSTPGP